MGRLGLFHNHIGHRRPTSKDISRMVSAACDTAGFVPKQIHVNPFWVEIMDSACKAVRHLAGFPVRYDTEMPTDRIYIESDSGERLAELRGLCDCTELRHV